MYKTSICNDKKAFYHGTKADLKKGDFIKIGCHSNYGKRRKANFVYFSATMNAAIWGAELAEGNMTERIYIVEPTGDFEDDPNLTDKKFKGNPTKSYRSKYPLRVIDEVLHWQGHTEDMLEKMRKNLEELKKQGIEAIND